MDNETETLRFLEVEYQRLQAGIDKFDEQRFKVKGWSITAAGAFVALGINSKQVMLLVAAAPIIFFFAFMELIYLNLQVSVTKRSNEIEELIELARREGVGAAHDSYVFGIGKVFRENEFRWKKVPALLRARPQITHFYLGIAISLLVGAVVLVII